MSEFNGPPVWVLEPHTAVRPTDYSITWEDIPDGWAVFCIPEFSLYIPGKRSVTWNKTVVVFPSEVEATRSVDFEIASKKNGSIVCFDNMAAAKSYIARQRKKQCS